MTAPRPTGSIDIWNFVDNVTGTTVRKWLRDSWARRKIVALQQAVAAIVVPTKTSDLTNDSGFITAASVPSASAVNPAMDGTASVGSATEWARGDHVHPHDTSKQDALSAAQLAAVNSGITAEYVTGKFAVISDTLTAASGSWTSYFSFPTGFTSVNCVCISISIQHPSTGIWRYGEGVNGANDRIFAEISASGVRLYNNQSALNGKAFKAVLMRTDI